MAFVFIHFHLATASHPNVLSPLLRPACGLSFFVPNARLN